MSQQEKLYNTVRTSGVIGIVTGSIVIAIGIAAGVLMIVSGAKLMFAKRNVMI